MTANEQLQMVDADPCGDVEFLIGAPDNAQSLRVSSKILGLASPVFAALSSPKYFEGSALLGSNKIPRIALPDDEPEALVLICHALHHQRATPRHIAFGLLEKAAIVCDKCDLGVVLAPWSGLWMQQWKANGFGTAHWSRILCLSFIFDDHEAFYLSTEKLMSSCLLKIPSTKEGKERGVGPGQEISQCLHEMLSITTQVRDIQGDHYLIRVVLGDIIEYADGF